MLTVTLDQIEALLAAAQEAQAAAPLDEGPEDDTARFFRLFRASSLFAALTQDAHPLATAISDMLRSGFISYRFDDPVLCPFPAEIRDMHACVRAGLLTGAVNSQPDYVIHFLQGYRAVLLGEKPTVPCCSGQDTDIDIGEIQ